MIIKTERDLVNKLSTVLTDNFNTDVVVNEFHGGYGIADIAFAKDFFVDTNKLNRPPVNNYYALRLLLDEERILTAEYAYKKLGISRLLSQKILNQLLTDGYLDKIDTKTFAKNYYQMINPIKSLVAIEAKLRDWKNGVLQARRYKAFTDECYLALLSDYEKNVDYSYLEKYDIGLIVLDGESGSIEFKRKPQQRTLHDIYSNELNFYAREMFLYQLQSSKTY